MDLHEEQCDGERPLERPRIVSENTSRAAKVASIIDNEEENNIASIQCDKW